MTLWTSTACSSDAPTENNNDTDTDADTDTDPLSNKFVGNIATSGSVRTDFLQYWDQITPENEGKWQGIEQTRDSYNWTGVDRVYNFAEENNIPFKEYTFISGAPWPVWIFHLDVTEPALEIEEFMDDFCERYPNTAMIDVVNEAVPGHAPASFA